jgi:hypothetical protein
VGGNSVLYKSAYIEITIMEWKREHIILHLGGELVIAVGLIFKLESNKFVVEEIAPHRKLLNAPTMDQAKRGILDYYKNRYGDQKLSVEFKEVSDGVKYIVTVIKNKTDRKASFTEWHHSPNRPRYRPKDPLS